MDGVRSRCRVRATNRNGGPHTPQELQMITTVRLFLSMKNEAVARPLGLRRLRRAPEAGQKFEVAVEGRPVHARIVRLSITSEGHDGLLSASDVYAEEF